MGCDFDEIIHVLAVDDSAVVLKIMEKLVIKCACKVTTAENGEMALEMLGLGDGNQVQPRQSVLKVNLIIIDYHMPGITGYQLMKKIKESPALKDIPVVIVSAENTLRQQCLEGGAEEFLKKPITLMAIKTLRCNLIKSNTMGTQKDSPSDDS